MKRWRLSLLVPLLIGVLGGLVVAVPLRHVLDEAVTDWAERDFVRVLARFAPEFEGVALDGKDAAERVARLSKALNVRVTLVARDGRVASDSAVEPGRLSVLENHAARPEVVAAMRSGVGTDRRRSATVGETFVYIAHRLGPGAAPTGCLRVAVRETDLASAEAPFRQTLTRFSAITGLIVGLLLVVVRLRHSRELLLVKTAVERAAIGQRPALKGPGEEVSDETATVFSALSQLAGAVKSERERSEEDKALARAVFEDVPVGLLVVSRAMKVLQANRLLFEILEVPESARREGGHLFELIRHTGLHRAFERGLLGEYVEREMLRLPMESGEGRERIVEISVRTVQGARDQPAVGVLTDVTAREKAEGLRQRFIADVSHELRTPVASILAASETLSSEEGLSGDGQRLFQIISRQATHMQDLIADLLDLAQLESGLIELRLTPVDLSELSREVVEDLGDALSAGAKTVELDVTKGLTLRADRRRLAQVLRNLLDNAIKFSPPGAAVRLVAERAVPDRPPRVVLKVIDTGIGIPPADHENIFRRFYRVDPSRAKSTPGTGLGLAIVRHLVRLHQGTIHVDSAPGHGSTFTVKLPIE